MDLDRKINYIQKVLKDDPLFKAVVSRGYDKELFSDSYLEDINTAGTYGTVKVAEWFNVSDSQLRYYIKPNIAYLVEEGTPVNEFAYRLTFTAVLKLRMMLLLKDDYKMKGLELLISEEAIVSQKPESLTTNDSKILENISKSVKEIASSGLFDIKIDEHSSEPIINLNANFFEKFSKKLPAEEEEKNKLFQNLKEIKADLRNEYNRLQYSENRIEDFNEYIAFLDIQPRKKWSFSSKRTDAELTKFKEKTLEKIANESDKVKVIKETVKSKELELKEIEKRILILDKAIEGLDTIPSNALENSASIGNNTEENTHRS